MPSQSSPIKLKYRYPKEEDAQGGKIITNVMGFEGKQDGIKYVIKITGSKSDVDKVFGNWPLEVGGHIEMGLKTNLSQKFMTEILAKAKKAKEDNGKGKISSIDETADAIEDL